MLKEICSKRGFEFFKKYPFIKKNVEKGASKTEITSIWKLHDVESLILERWYKHQTVLKIKERIWTSGKSILSKKQEHGGWKEPSLVFQRREDQIYTVYKK